MKIAIGADHAGFALKQTLAERLRQQGYQVEDLGTNTVESVDYPDFAAAVAHKVADGKVDKGILVCSSGVGMSIAANKIHGIRAALGVSVEEVDVVRRHNDANILTLGARFTSEPLAEAMVDKFLTTGFDAGRHERRIHKINAIEVSENLHQLGSDA